MGRSRGSSWAELRMLGTLEGGVGRCVAWRKAGGEGLWNEDCPEQTGGNSSELVKELGGVKILL